MKKSENPRYCRVCGKQINHLHFNRKTCESAECQEAWRKKVYSNHEKVCKRCGKIFIGTYHQLYCTDCRNNYNIHDSFITGSHDKYKTIKNIICPRCGKVMGSKETFSSAENIKSDSLCEECLSKTSQYLSERMKGDKNPMRNPDVSNKYSKTREKLYIEKCKNLGITPNLEERRLRLARCSKKIYSTKEEYRKGLSERMKGDKNPMRNPKIVEKCRKTLREHILSGKISIKRGKDRYNYKGGQKINKAIRINLKEWRKQVLALSDYTCKVCGKRGGRLHIHHLYPLREIIDETCLHFNITRELINKQKDSDLFKEIVEKIVQFHLNHPEIGVVVCEQCHSKVDKYFFKKRDNNENKKN